ncbi:MAG: NTP transferase domain-containing protein [Armatimonadota bacterium]|nr:NTP transferase domain-containing protein [Armatimonadota bacterium]
MSKSNIGVVILAGAQAGQLFPQNSSISRGMVPVAGKPMVQWVVDAFRGVPSVDRIVVVGDVDVVGADAVVPPCGGFVDNLRKGLECMEPDQKVILASCDIPMLTAESVEDFIGRAREANADFVYPIVPRSQCEAQYPGVKRTYLRTADGVFTGGNLVLVNPRFVLENWRIIREAYEARKHVLRLARIIGLSIVFRVLISMVCPRALKVSDLERAAARLLSGSVAAVVSEYPEIAEDVDKPSDLHAVERFLEKRVGNSK